MHYKCFSTEEFIIYFYIIYTVCHLNWTFTKLQKSLLSQTVCNIQKKYNNDDIEIKLLLHPTSIRGFIKYFITDLTKIAPGANEKFNVCNSMRWKVR